MYWNFVKVTFSWQKIEIEPTHEMYWNISTSTLKVALMDRTDTWDVLKQCCDWSSETFYSIEPTHEMYWNRLKPLTLPPCRRIEPTHEMYWNTGNLAKINQINNNRTDTWDVLKPTKAIQKTKQCKKSNRHMRCIETRKYQLENYTGFIEPTHEMYWNRDWALAKDKEFHRTDTWDVLKLIQSFGRKYQLTSNRHMRCIETIFFG